MAVLTGTGAVDVLYGHAQDDQIDGRGGDDFLYGRGGDDLIIGGRGEDILAGGGGDDTVRGGAGADFITDYNRGSDLILGGTGDDFIHTQRSKLNDTSLVRIRAGAGDDTVLNDSVGLHARARIDLGAGDDTFKMLANKGSLRVNLGEGSDTILIASRYGGGDGPAVIHHFTAGAGGDLIDLNSPGALTDGGLIGFTTGDDLFGLGYARLVKHGTSTYFQIDGTGGGDFFHTVLILKNVDPEDITAANLDGYDPAGESFVT